MAMEQAAAGAGPLALNGLQLRGSEIVHRMRLPREFGEHGAAQQQLRVMLPSAGVYYFPWEINSSIPEGEVLRTFGRLSHYDLVQSKAILTAQHSSAQYQVCVNTEFVEPFQAQLGSCYMVLGEAEHKEGKDPVVKARILTCVEGMNVPLLEQAIQEQRKYFNERQEQMGDSAS